MAQAKRDPYSYEYDEGTLTVVKGDKVLRSYDFNGVPEELDDQFMILGRTTKLVNFGANAKKLGRDKLDMMDEGFARLCQGEWEKEREGGGPTVSAEVEALSRLRKLSVGQVQKVLRTYSAEDRKKILARPEVVKMAETIRAERATEEPESFDDLL